MPLNEREFILRALCDNIRADGRFFLEMRKVRAAHTTGACEGGRLPCSPSNG